jgi:polysaccharide biosynthesis/export protein
MLMIAIATVSGCATPNDHIITDSTRTPAAHQYMTSDSLVRYSASCHDNDEWRTSDKTLHSALELIAVEARHSAGDIVQVTVLDNAEFSGNYEINFDGRLVVPYAGSVVAAGLTTTQLQDVLRRKLTSSGMLQDHDVKVAVLPVKWAPIQVSIEGAVYQPGTDFINEPSEKPLQTLITKTGESPLGRFLREAFRVGAGVRPDADLSNIALTRKGKTYRLDLSGAINGGPVPLIPLMSGDIVSVPSSGCFHRALFRPSQVTPPGIRVFMSNLTQTAINNTSAAIGQYASSVPDGTRLIEASVSANCVGGTVSVNAARRVVLISRNTLDRKTEVIERSISELMAKPDDPATNPYLMPNDAIACYDSEFTNARDVAKGITDILSAVSVMKLL